MTGADPTTLKPPELLNANHELMHFDCGEPLLDEWLRRRAMANQFAHVARSYVVCRELQVVGYYTLAAGAIALVEAPGRVRRNMPNPIPMALLGRFAVDRAWQANGLGRLLLRDAILRARHAAEVIGVRGILVHALSPAAKRFYANGGFVESPANPMTLLLPFNWDAA